MSEKIVLRLRNDDGLNAKLSRDKKGLSGKLSPGFGSV